MTIKIHYRYFSSSVNWVSLVTVVFHCYLTLTLSTYSCNNKMKSTHLFYDYVQFQTAERSQLLARFNHSSIISTLEDKNIQIEFENWERRRPLIKNSPCILLVKDKKEKKREKTETVLNFQVNDGTPTFAGCFAASYLPMKART